MGRKTRVLPGQLGLFDSLGAQEPQGKPCPVEVDPEPIVVDHSWRRQVPAEMDYDNFSPESWLGNLIDAGELFIFVFNREKHLCRITCGSSWEYFAQQYVDRAIMSKKVAEEILADGGYIVHSNHTTGNGDTGRAYVIRK